MSIERKLPEAEDFEMPSFDLKGKIVLVTGGSRGLGLGMAQALACAGADVALLARSKVRLDKAADVIRNMYERRVITIPFDLGNTNEIPSVFEQVKNSFGQIDVLVNAAGTNVRKPAKDARIDEWDQVMGLNLKAVFFTCQEAARLMKDNGGGKVINVGSMTFERQVPNVALYSASKGGLRSLTQALALEWAPYNIQVNCIVPGRFWTAMTDKVFSNPELFQSAVSVIPQGRPGMSSDLAGTILLLATNASDYITGQSIVVDGGWMINSGIKG